MDHSCPFLLWGWLCTGLAGPVVSMSVTSYVLSALNLEALSMNEESNTHFTGMARARLVQESLYWPGAGAQ